MLETEKGRSDHANTELKEDKVTVPETEQGTESPMLESEQGQSDHAGN